MLLVSAIAYLPFRIVSLPTRWVGHVVAWLAEGYREATAIERALIFPTWAILRSVFLIGHALAHGLHAAARWSMGH